MDLNGRVERMDEELKLLKNEIKQILLDVQENVLNVQNPFSGGGAGFAIPQQPPGPSRMAQEAPASGPTGPSTIFIDTSVDTGQGQQPPGDFGGVGSPLGRPAFPGGGPTGQEDPFVEASGPGLAPPGAAMSEPSPSPFSSGDSRVSPLSLDDPLGEQPEVGDLISENDDEDDADGPGAGPPPPKSAAEDEAQESMKPARKLSKKAQKAPVEADEEDEEEQDVEEEREEGRKRPKKSRELDAEDEDMEDDYADDYVASDSSDGHDVESAGARSRSRRAVARPEREKEQRIDLVTLAGLAQWAERALNRVGSEHFKALLEVSEITGRIPKEMKEALTLLIPLLEDRDSDRRITAKEIVTLIAQLGGFLGSATMADLRLLPFLLQDDTEVFPLIRQ